MEQIKNIAFKMGIITTQDLRVYTTLELLMKIIEKMNELIVASNQLSEEVKAELQKMMDKINYLLNQGLQEEVLKQLNKWLADGTLESLINQTALKGISDRVSDIESDRTDIFAKPQIVFQFDDGYGGDQRTMQILESYGLVGCFALNNSKFYDSNRLGLKAYAEAQQKGHEILSHTIDHLDWRPSSGINPTQGDVRYQYGQSIQQMQLMGFNVNHVVVPYSQASAYVYNQAKLYCDMVIVGQEIANPKSGLNDRTSIKDRIIYRVSQHQLGLEQAKAKVDQAIAENKMLVFYDHEINAENSMSQADFSQLCVYVKEKVTQGLAENNNTTVALSRLFGWIPTPKKIGMDSTNYHQEFKLTVPNGATLEKGVWENVAPLKEVEILTIPSTLGVGEDVIIETFFNTKNTLRDMNGVLKLSFNVLYGYSDASKYEMEINVRYVGNDGSEVRRVTYPRYTLQSNNQLFDETIYAPVGLNLDEIKDVTATIRFTKVGSASTQGKVILSNVCFGYGTHFKPSPKGVGNTQLDITTSKNYVAQQTTSELNVDTSDYIIVKMASATNITLPKAPIHVGKVRTLVFVDGNSTLTKDNFSLKGNVDFNPQKGDSITLVYTPHLSGNWCEINRFTKA